MNILSNLVPKFGLANSKTNETNVDSDLHEAPQDLSLVEGSDISIQRSLSFANALLTHEYSSTSRSVGRRR